jgi:hypothetical protein
MEDRVATSYVKIRYPVIYNTEILTVCHNLLHLLPSHAGKALTALPRENITVLAALVTFVRNMPLKRKILAHPIPPL